MSSPVKKQLEEALRESFHSGHELTSFFQYEMEIRLIRLMRVVSRGGGPHSLDKKRPFLSYTLPSFLIGNFSVLLSSRHAFWYRQPAR